jgi:predicted methyltransferase
MRKKWKIKNQLQFWGVMIVCFALINALLPIGIFSILTKQINTTSWSSVQGTIIICEVEHRYNEYADSGEEDEYRINLVYQYIVNNETYESSNVYY